MSGWREEGVGEGRSWGRLGVLRGVIKFKKRK